MFSPAASLYVYIIYSKNEMTLSKPFTAKSICLENLTQSFLFERNFVRLCGIKNDHLYTLYIFFFQPYHRIAYVISYKRTNVRKSLNEI